VLGIIGRWAMVDKMVRSASVCDPNFAAGSAEGFVQQIKEYEHAYIDKMIDLMVETGKPIVGVSLLDATEGNIARKEGARYSGVHFATPEKAVRMLGLMQQYRARTELLQRALRENPN